MPRLNAAVNVLPQVPPPPGPTPAALEVDLALTDDDLGDLAEELLQLNPGYQRVALVLADPHMIGATTEEVAAAAGVHYKTVYRARAQSVVQEMQARSCRAVLVQSLPKIMGALCSSASDPESKHGASDRRLAAEIVGLVGADRAQASSISITVTQAPPQQSATLSSIAIVPAGSDEGDEG